jgi:hypothetical protein
VERSARRWPTRRPEDPVRGGSTWPRRRPPDRGSSRSTSPRTSARLPRARGLRHRRDHLPAARLLGPDRPREPVDPQGRRVRFTAPLQLRGHRPAAGRQAAARHRCDARAHPRALEELARQGRALSDVTLASDGRTVYAIDDDRQLLDLLSAVRACSPSRSTRSSTSCGARSACCHRRAASRSRPTRSWLPTCRSRPEPSDVRRPVS